MAIEKLTASKVARISKPGKYSDGNGLYLQVTKSFVKSWVFRYQTNGKEHYMGLGPLHAVDIKEAREKARKARACLSRKVDPLQERMMITIKREKMEGFIEYSKTFDECVIEYIAHHKHGWKSAKHLKQWENSLRTYVSPNFGKMLVREITTVLVLKVLEPIWAIKTETASRLRERIERVLSWATICGYREGDNPARWNGHLQELLPKPSRIKIVRHYPSIPYQEIGEFFRLLNAEESIVARVLEFTIITVCRTSEALYARWQEMDLARCVWIIPGDRMKNGRMHRVPLTDAALKTLGMLKGLHPDWVFPNLKRGKPYCETVMFNLLRRMKRPGITVHGFRSTFRVWAAERTSYPWEIAEMALAHRQAKAVEEAYQRSDLFERRQALMQDWADWCYPIPRPTRPWGLAWLRARQPREETSVSL
ncbi:MAG: integrase arm-type DNA-binding domain-containing protein [Betaproteobacteria bacterium]|nr:integrase arm-type DNA-binding domain-containing protein [Betaproteobacteria bacterium]